MGKSPFLMGKIHPFLMGKIHPVLMGKLTISMAIFNSYFDITRGSYSMNIPLQSHVQYPMIHSLP
jgi:hypothetical protein